MNLNSAAVRADWTLKLGTAFVTASMYPRLHLLTCTVSRRRCGDGGGLAGARAFEQVAEVVVDTHAPLASAGTRLFASMAGAWLFPHALAVEERRLTMDLGLARNVSDVGFGCAGRRDTSESAGSRTARVESSVVARISECGRSRVC